MFDFIPKTVIIIGDYYYYDMNNSYSTNRTTSGIGIYAWDRPVMMNILSTSIIADIVVSATNSTMNWYNTQSAVQQLNGKSKKGVVSETYTYSYVGIN